MLKYGKYLYKTYDRRRLHGMIVPSTTSKKEICTFMNNYKGNNNKQYLFVDIDILITSKLENSRQTLSLISNSEQIKETLLYPSIKNEIDELLSSFVNHLIIIVSSSDALMNFLCIKRKRIDVLVPSLDLWEEIKGKNDKETEMNQVRENIIMRYGYSIFIFRTFEELYNALIKKFDLIRTL